MKKEISKRILAIALASGMLTQSTAMADYLPKFVMGGGQEYNEPIIAEQISDNAELLATEKETEDGWKYYDRTDDNENKYIEISGIDEDKISGDIIIPSEIDGVSVTKIGYEAFADCTSLTSITIPESVTGIGYGAFRGCTSLPSVTIPDSVTEIGGFAFADCTSLPSVTIPESVTGIGYGAFRGCTNLTSVTIPDSVTEIGGFAFDDCTSLISITIPDSVTEIGSYAFSDTAYYNNQVNWENDVLYISGCLIKAKDSIKKCDIKSDTRLIADSAFHSSSLTSVTIPNSVTKIGEWAFSYCGRLTSVTIPDSVAEIGEYTFHCCTNLTSVTILDSVTEIGSEAFSQCKSLTNVMIPDSVTYIGYRAFSFCESLTSASIPASATNIYDNAFEGCGSLNITVAENNENYSSVDGVLFNKDKTALRAYAKDKIQPEYTIPNSVTYIGSCAFDGCESLTSITIPDSVTDIGMMAFSACRSLTSMTIPESVTYIGYNAFSGCNNFTIRSYAGSYAEGYAKENDIPFKLITFTATAVINNNKVTITFTPVDGVVATFPSNAIIVQYSNSGNISGLDENVEIKNNTATVNAAEEVEYIKIFNWDSLENMQPKGEVMLIPIKK